MDTVLGPAVGLVLIWRTDEDHLAVPKSHTEMAFYEFLVLQKNRYTILNSKDEPIPISSQVLATVRAYLDSSKAAA